MLSITVTPAWAWWLWPSVRHWPLRGSGGSGSDLQLRRRSVRVFKFTGRWQLTVTVNVCAGESPSPTTVESVWNSEPVTGVYVTCFKFHRPRQEGRFSKFRTRMGQCFNSNVLCMAKQSDAASARSGLMHGLLDPRMCKTTLEHQGTASFNFWKPKVCSKFHQFSFC